MGCPGTDQCNNCFTNKFATGHPDYQIFRRNIFRQSLKKAAAIIAPCHDTARRLREVYEDLEVTVIPHGSHAIASRRRVRQPGEAVRFGFIGNLTNQKGVNVLIAAFHRAVRRIPCELHLWGALNYHDIVLGNTPHLYYNGSYSRDEVGAIAGQVDVGVIPSIFPETFCYTLSELASAGLPCLVADIGSLGERVDHGANGWKAAPGDIKAWEESLVTLASEPQRIDSLSSLPAVRPVSEMCADYDRLYADVGSSIAGSHGVVTEGSYAA
jgi:glycosyltransferase involved in cell wall biosynthesis